MTLAAAQVVAAVVDRLSDVVATAGRVYADRHHALAESDLPAWTVQAAEETVVPLSMHYPAEQQHDLSIDAAVHARDSSGIDDTMHALVAAGLAELFATVPPYQLRLDGISRAADERNESSIARHTLRLTATFTTVANAPETITSE